jgi:5-methylcytosine-specific restriction endonuclease McrA
MGSRRVVERQLPNERSLEEILTVNSTYRTAHLRERLFCAGLKKRKCEGCGLTEWMGEAIPLELDHVNGVPDDHRLENLRVLCPNCHALTPTWRGRRNRKHGALAHVGRAAA